jgi:1,4-dihydroxy-2-naphthoate octaprenyltransferase
VPKTPLQTLFERIDDSVAQTEWSCVLMCAYVCLFVFTCVYVCLCVFMSVYVCLCVFICVYV